MTKNAKDAAGLTWKQFSNEMFECEYCHECYGDAHDHIACIGPFGLWFAMCKFTPMDERTGFRNGKLITI